MGYHIIPTLNEVFHAGNTITIADGENKTLTITNNDTTNNPKTLEIINTTTNSAFYLDQNGNTGSTPAFYIENTGNTGRGFEVYSNAATATSALARFYAANTDFNKNLLICSNFSTGAGSGISIRNDGTNSGISLEQNGSATNGGLYIHGTSDKGLVYIYSNRGGDATQPVMKIVEDGSTFIQPVLSITQDGTSPAIEVDMNGDLADTSKGAIYVEGTGTNTSLLSLYTNNGATATHPVFNMHIDNSAFDQMGQLITTDGASSALMCELTHAGAMAASGIILRDTNAAFDVSLLYLSHAGTGNFITGATASAPYLSNAGLWVDVT